jgi:uncharacterized membrane protein YcaP (DUF421 family)
MDVNWSAMWVPTLPLMELVIRGTVLYLALFVYFRLLRREAGSLGVTDVLFVVLIADASQQAMASDYKSITEGFVLIGTLAFWDVLLNVLAYRFRWAGKLIEPPPIPLIRDGKMLRRNMRRELITVDELLAHLRLHEVASPDEVASCVLESNGEFSVIRK